MQRVGRQFDECIRAHGIVRGAAVRALERGLCTRAYVMDAGRITESGPTARLFNHPQAEATQRLIEAIMEI